MASGRKRRRARLTHTGLPKGHLCPASEHARLRQFQSLSEVAQQDWGAGLWRIQRLSFMWPRKVSQEGSSEFCPPGSAGRESFEPRLCRFGCGTPRTIFENATSDMPPIEKVSSI